jgi:hypothetical protein
MLLEVHQALVNPTDELARSLVVLRVVQSVALDFTNVDVHISCSQTQFLYLLGIKLNTTRSTSLRILSS